MADSRYRRDGCHGRPHSGDRRKWGAVGWRGRSPHRGDIDSDVSLQAALPGRFCMKGSLIDCGHGVRLERSVPCPMSDGVILNADHYYPPEPGPHPSLLMRQPYGRDIASTVVYAHPVWFARHGYHVVIQDVRGRGDSEGDFYPFRHEGTDGFDTIS